MEFFKKCTRGFVGKQKQLEQHWVKKLLFFVPLSGGLNQCITCKKDFSPCALSFRLTKVDVKKLNCQPNYTVQSIWLLLTKWFDLVRPSERISHGAWCVELSHLLADSVTYTERPSGLPPLRLLASSNVAALDIWHLTLSDPLKQHDCKNILSQVILEDQNKALCKM